MKNNDPLTWVCRTNSNHLGFESSVKEKDHQTDHVQKTPDTEFESSVKEKDHQTMNSGFIPELCLRAV